MTRSDLSTTSRRIYDALSGAGARISECRLEEGSNALSLVLPNGTTLNVAEEPSRPGFYRMANLILFVPRKGTMPMLSLRRPVFGATIQDVVDRINDALPPQRLLPT